jgi:hypothetical protein
MYYIVGSYEKGMHKMLQKVYITIKYIILSFKSLFTEKVD